MIFLSEYSGLNRTAEVYRRNTLNDFVVIGYENCIERVGHPFPTEQAAEDWAEDWINGLKI